VRRHDVSRVPPQGGYVAKQCPVRAQNEVLVPAVPIPVSAELQRRFDRGRAFEHVAVTELEDAGVGAWIAEGETPEELEAATADAIEDEAPVIIGARLPTDVAGRRVGKPDLLVIARDQGYRPVDVKHHMALEPAIQPGRGIPALVSTLEAPAFEDAVVDELFAARKREDDLLQLAHYQRMLEAAGLASPGGRWGGIVGTERRIVWYDLDAPIWRTPSSTGKQKIRTTMERYDFEFDFRLDVISAAREYKLDPSVDLLVVPVRVSECDECPWWDYCRGRLESGSGDVSLLPRIGWREWKIHHDHGVDNRGALAGLDIRTARLVAAGVNVPELQALIEDLPLETPIGDLKVVIRSKLQLGRLDDAGVRTFGELAGLSEATASYFGSGMSALPEQIDLARAALGSESIYRRRDIGDIAVARADVEVDVDMENIEEGVYLWGALVTERGADGVSSRYHAFAAWDPLTPDAETANSLRFWSWFTGMRDVAARSGRSFRAYCYNASAENTYLRRLGVAGGMLEEVTSFIGSEDWVDLLQVVDDQLITGGSCGLKKIAPIAGFEWDVDDPGGGVSMLYYDAAARGSGATERDAARSWLLSYNEGDVRATLAIRDWLDERGQSIMPIESLDDQFSSGSASQRLAG
jgi:predicted RecB family nuclease